jgi:ABC-type transporter Mla MlaB component
MAIRVPSVTTPIAHAVDVPDVNMTQDEAITLPAQLDQAGVAAFGAMLEQARGGASITLDGSQVRRVHTPGVQLLCALVLAAEGRGAVVTWTSVPSILVTYVRLLGISDMLQFHRGVPEALDHFE